LLFFFPKATGRDAQGLNFLFQPGQFKFPSGVRLS